MSKYDKLKSLGRDTGRIREKIQLMRSKRLSPVDLFKAAFAAAAAVATRRGKRLVGFVQQAVAKVLPQAARPAAGGSRAKPSPSLRL